MKVRLTLSDREAGALLLALNVRLEGEFTGDYRQMLTEMRDKVARKLQAYYDSESAIADYETQLDADQRAHERMLDSQEREREDRYEAVQ